LSALGVSGTPDPAAASGLGNVLVLGADGEIKLANRVSLTADFSKSLTDTTQQSAPNADANNAFNATLGFGSGGLSVNAGYRYVDPLYYSPGYWGRIGSWVNPTNIQGPTFRAAYDFSNSFGLNVGGEFFSAAHDRSVVGGLNADDDISRLLVGVRWNPVRNLRTTLDWEGVYWSLSGLHNGIYAIGPGAVAHPTENYITLGTGYNFTRNTLFRLDYHFGIWDGHGALNSVGFGQYNFNAVTGQFSVKF
jgi:hypothetical protein